MTTRFTPFLDEIDAALQENQSLKDQIVNLRNEKAELTNTLAVTRGVLTNKMTYIQNLEGTLKEKLEEISNLNDQVNNMEERLDDALEGQGR